MENTDLEPLMEDLRDSVDDLELALAPLLRAPHGEITSKLPLLDKAKVSVLTTYAIESILFSVLKLNGIDAKQHPIFTELTRVKQYFEKIKNAENGGPAKRANMKLNAPAANRFIKAALAGNEKFDKERLQRQVEERQVVHKRFHDLDSASAESTPAQASPKKRKIATKTQYHEHELPAGPISERSYPSGDVDGSNAHPAPADTSLDDEEDREQRRPKKERKDQRRKDRERDNNGKSRKVKSTKPPRDNKTIFNDLLGRQDANTG